MISSSSSISPYSSNSKRLNNDVFMNYSVEDIGNNFKGHLQRSLTRNGFSVFDHVMLPFGHDVCSQLLQAIEESEIYVVIFSTNYACSLRCLNELVDIVACHGKYRKILPVFFKVEPSHVRNQEGPFKEAFEAHETNIDPERVQKWKQALKDVGRLSGLTLKNDGDEGDFISEIAIEVERMKRPQKMHVAEHSVGIGPRAEELISKLRLDCEDVLVVAVFGISGIGKTTVVKAVYNQISSYYGASCFLEDIHANYCGRQNWKEKLQKKLISCLTLNHKLPVMNCDRVTKLRMLISGQKILLVLDDVQKFQQLEALGINPAWFYKGSRIIVTTRDKQSLGGIQYASYDTMLLNRRESLNLFTRLMFASVGPEDMKFIEVVVHHAGGLPLVLEVWSRYFIGHAREQWPNLLKKIKCIPHKDTQEKLQISYESLGGRAKTLFLDIACFFIGMDKDLVVKVLHDEESAFFPDIEIQDLIDKFLVKGINHENQKLLMNQVIREMGQEVVRQENDEEPGKRTRLTDHRDVVRVFKDCSGTDSIRSIRLDDHGMKDEPVTLQVVETFKTMSNVRFIKLLGKEPSWSFSSYDDMSSFSLKLLKYLEWEGFPFKRINSINMGNVVVIKLYHCHGLKILWEGNKSLKKLRILDVCYSKNLTKTGDFNGLENLEELILRVSKLKQLDSSIGSLRSLKVLNLDEHKFDSLPDTVCQLHQLSNITLSSCKNLRSIPYLPPNIKTVTAEKCVSLVNLPLNMSELKSLTSLYLDNCLKLGSEGFTKVTGLRHLKRLSMRNCNISKVSSDIRNMVSLYDLNLSKNKFSSLPESFVNLSRLMFLRVDDCPRLQLLPLLPSRLMTIHAFGCRSLDVMPFDSKQKAYTFRSTAFKESAFATIVLSITLTGKVVPDLCNQYLCCDSSFEVPMLRDKKICGLILCATRFINPYSNEKYISTRMLNITKGTSQDFWGTKLGDSSMCVMFCPLNDKILVVEAGDIMDLKINNNDFIKCGLRLVYEDDIVDSKIVIKDDDDDDDDGDDEDDDEDDNDHDEFNDSDDDDDDDDEPFYDVFSGWWYGF